MNVPMIDRRRPRLGKNFRARCSGGYSRLHHLAVGSAFAAGIAPGSRGAKPGQGVVLSWRRRDVGRRSLPSFAEESLSWLSRAESRSRNATLDICPRQRGLLIELPRALGI